MVGGYQEVIGPFSLSISIWDRHKLQMVLSFTLNVKAPFAVYAICNVTMYCPSQ